MPIADLRLTRYRAPLHQRRGVFLNNMFSMQNYLQTRRHKRLVSFLDIPNDSAVLDISCDEGDVLEILRRYGSISVGHGIDMSEESIERAKTKYPWATFSTASAESLPYPPNSFTSIISCLSLHHYDKPQEVFKEVARVLILDGTFSIIDLVPTFRWSQKLHNWDGCPEPYHFEKYYLKTEIESLASSAELHICEEKKLNWFSGIRLLTFKKTGQYR